MMKKLIGLGMLVLFCLVSVQAQAAQMSIPAGTLQQQQTFNFYNVVNTLQVAQVTSSVYAANAGGYIYAYQIANATTDFSWFSVGLLPSVVVSNANYDVAGGQVAPSAWTILPSSVEASFFSNPVGLGETSAVLWFQSPSAPAPNNSVGALSGYSYKGFTFAQGTVLTPSVPEPMTSILLSAGALAMVATRKRK